MFRKALIIAICSSLAGHFTTIQGGGLWSKSSNLLRPGHHECRVLRGVPKDEEQASSSSFSSPSTQATTQQLFDAIYTERAQEVQELIDAGIDANAETHIGLPVLRWALCFCNPRIVKALVKAGANVNAGYDGQTALTIAARYEDKNMDCAKILVKAIIAANAATEEAHSLDIQERFTGNTALHYLVKRAIGHDSGDNSSRSKVSITSINYLIGMMLNEGGADPLIVNHDGKTPVDVAVEHGIYDQLPAFADYFRKKKQLVIGDRLAMEDRYMIDDVADIVGQY